MPAFAGLMMFVSTAAMFAAAEPAPAVDPAKAEAEARAAAEKLYRDIYGENHDRAAKSKDAAEKVKFAKSLAEAAKTASADKALAGVLRERALEFAIADATGLAVSRELVAAVPPRSPGRAAALEKIAEFMEKALLKEPMAKRGVPALELVGVLRDLADEQAAQGRAPVALKTLAKAKSAVKTHLKGAKDKLAEIDKQEEGIEEVASSATRHTAALATLKAKPDDPGANLAMAVHLIAAEKSPADAIPHLRKSGITAFLKLADAMEKAEPDHKEIGDAYRAAAPLVSDTAGRKAFSGRAAGHYQYALRADPKHPDAVRLRLIISQITADTPAIPVSAASVAKALNPPATKGETPTPTPTPTTKGEGGPADRLLAGVVAELVKLNPGFDGKVEHKIEGGEVVELGFATQKVSDISPLKALTGLKRLYLRATGKEPGKVADLSPIKELELNLLQVCDNPITDLSAISGMPMKSLSISFNPDRDARLLAKSKPITSWTILSPLPDTAKLPYDLAAGGGAPTKADLAKSHPGHDGSAVTWKPVEAGANGVVTERRLNKATLFAYATIESEEDQEIRMLAGSDDTVVIWVNGEKVHEYRTEWRESANICDRFVVKVKKGVNHVLLRCDNNTGTWEFAVRVPMDIGLPGK